MEYDILLINVYRDANEFSNGFGDSIGQYTLAAYLRKHDFIGQVFSGTIGTCKEAINHELSEGHVGIVGFYAAADNIRIVKHAVEWVKEHYPKAVTIVGGPQAIALDADFFQSTGNDYAIVGEGEIPLRLLLSYLTDGVGAYTEVPSLVYYDSVQKDIVWNFCDNAVIENLDEIPFPHMEDSLDGSLRQSRMVGIITGRGCPNHCTFCYEGNNSKHVRFRSIGHVLKEIDYIREHNRQLDFINVYDDTFTLQPERVLAFCKGMKERGLKWFCEGHVSFVVQHPELFQVMVDSGLTCIQFGIESGSQTVLDAYHKKTSADMILRCIEICKESGVNGITGNFIIGGAMESEETLCESRELAEKMIDIGRGVTELFSVYFAPYPNTKMANHPSKFGIFRHPTLEHWNLNTMRSPVISTANLSAAEIHGEKQRFDRFLADCYLRGARNITKQELITCLFRDGRRIHININWEKALFQYSYIETFSKHISENEQKFDGAAYPIRTFDDYLIEGNTICTEAGKFSGIEKDILLNSTGIRTATELSLQLGISIEQFGNCYQRLNNRCLIYMSSW